MTIFAQITPRRLVLACLLALGLGLRFWGLAWGPEGNGQHSGEWTWQIIDSLSFSQPTFYGVWTQTFFSLAALLNGLASWLAGAVGLITGQVRNLSEVSFSALLAGRATVAFLGGAQVGLVYLVARRYFDSVATGLLAASLVAVSPLLVMQGHYLSLDVPLGFMVLLCMNQAWHMSEHPRAGVMAVSGLILGLTITTRASGVLAAPLLAGAYWLGVRQARPARSRAFLIWPLSMLGGLALGVLLGYPGLLLDAENTQQVLQTSLAMPLAPGEAWWRFWLRRWQESSGVLLGSPGLELLVLWALGLGILIKRRQARRLLVALFPPLYFLASLLALSGPQEGLISVWLPLAAILACWPLVVVCRRLPVYSWQVAAVAALALVLNLWPLWRTMRADYLFWQQDTATSARHWLQDNLPSGSVLQVGPRVPIDLDTASQPLDLEASLENTIKTGGYLLSSPPETGGAVGYAKLDLLQQVMSFSLKQPPLSSPNQALSNPRWVSPRLNIYAALPASKIIEPLALLRPGAGQERPFEVVYGDHGAYSRSQGVIQLKPGQQFQRILRLSRPLDRVRVSLSNQGQDLALLELGQGFWPKQRVALYPGQETSLMLEAREWPPFVEYLYPFKFRLLRGGDFVARLDWDPLLMARRALEDGGHALAVELLGGLDDPLQGFDARAMLAEAYVRLGKIAEAERALSAGPEVKETDQAFRDLVLGQKDGPEWDRGFQRLTGYHPGLLRRACSLSYDTKGAQCGPDGEGVSLKGNGFIGSIVKDPASQETRIRLWPQDSFPRGSLLATCLLGAAGSVDADKLAAEVEVWGFDSFGGHKLAGRQVFGRDLPKGRARVALPVFCPRSGTRMELRFRQPASSGANLERLDVSVDLRAHMRHILRWHLDASGMVALSRGRFKQAVSDLSSLLALDPDYSQAYLPLAKAYLDAGKLVEAYLRAQRAEDYFQGHVAQLAQVREIYLQMQKKQDAARVEKHLAHLRPSLKHQSRFSGGMTLLGYDLPKAQAEPGGKLAVNWYWRCWSPPSLDYFIFVHLRGPDKTLNYDHLLDHGRLAMPDLEVGQVVREDYTLDIPKDAKPGLYKLVVGLWDPRFTGKGMPVLEGKGQGSEEVTLAEIKIGPKTR